MSAAGHAGSARGFILPFAVVAVGIMMLAAAAMVAWMNSSAVGTGNFSIKRDLRQQSDRALLAALAAFDTGALATEAARNASLAAANYSATMLPVDGRGVPNALLGDTAFSVVGQAANDIVVADQGVTVRYVIDRLCGNTGAAAATHCRMLAAAAPAGGNGSDMVLAEEGSSGGAGAVGTQVVYRLSVRVDGPRGAQSYFQATLSR
jgi:type IV pilus assembly protein PilX